MNDIVLMLKEGMNMAVIRVPFCATAELWPPFMLDEDFSDPNGVKSVMFDTSRLQVVAKQETIEVPDIGRVDMCIYYVVGSIPYICAAYPVVESEAKYDTQQRMSTFNNAANNTSAGCAGTTPSDPLGWVSAAGCAQVDTAIGGTCALTPIPDIEGITVENLAVANNLTATQFPTCSYDGEEAKRVVKWRGSFVITTTD